MIGTTIGHFEILEKLGEGGMGVVWKARDTRLGRLVALKVLSSEKVADADRKRRFVQEAKAASALNHPNIVTIYEIDQAGAVDFIAMEFVTGKTLDQLIPRKGLRINEALKYAIQIADALAAAHGAGIVHRDLKPANVMVGGNDAVKVLDFGIAKLTETGGTTESQRTQTIADQPQTEEGVILGTFSYMSPEQAEGKKVDARSDIFSFGSVLYEMVTGHRAFKEETRLSTLAAILNKEPAAIGDIATDAPRDLEKIITRCLRKDPNRRFQHMADVKVALEELKEESESGRLERSMAVPANRSASISSRLAVVALAVVVAAAGAAWWLFRPKAPASLRTPKLVRITSDSGLTTDPALSPDGKLLAFASDRSGEGNLDIWVRQVSGGEAIRLTRDPADDSEPVFSPDGSKIAFRSERDGGGIYIMSALGGEARRVVRQGRRPRFSPDGSQIAYTVGEWQLAAAGKLFVVPSEGGQTRQIQPDFFAALTPVWAPDGRHILFDGVRDGNVPDNDWWVAPLDGGAPVRTGAVAVLRQQRLRNMLPGTWWAAADSLIFSASPGDTVNLWQIAISPKTWQVAGPPRQLTSGTGLEIQPSLAGGHLAFTVLSANTNIWSLPVDANAGSAHGDIARLTDSADRETTPSLSVDGKKLAYDRFAAGKTSLWLRDLQDKQERLLATQTRTGGSAQISPDGTRVVIDKVENQKNFLSVLPTGGGEAEKVCDDCRVPTGWSHDGKKILYEVLAARALVLVDLASGHKTEILKHPKYGLSRGRFSPDDRWICFHSITPTARRIFIAPFRGAALIPENEWIPITDGQAMDRYGAWSPDGNLLYFLSERDGFRCIWAQRLDRATKHPAGAAFPVQHFHTSRRSLTTIGDPIYTGMSVGVDKIVFSMTEQTGNIWMTDLP